MKQWPVNKAYFWETAPFSRLLLPLIAGIVSYRFLSFAITTVVIVAIACTAVSLILTRIKASKTVRALQFVLPHVIIFLAAWSLCWFNDIKNDEHWFGKDAAAAEAFMVVVTKPPVEKDKTWKLETSVPGSISNDHLASTTGKALIYVFKSGYRSISQGDTLIVPNKWQAIRNAGNPFEFDYAGYCARHNLYYQQFLAPQDIIVAGKASASSRSWIDVLHEACMRQLERYVHNRQTLGLLQAMLIGDEANLDSDLRQAYSETGIIHVIAISGSHIAFLFFMITFLLGWIKNRKYHWMKYAIALPLVWAYVLIAGAPPSAVRAAIMFSILGLGFALQKQPNTLNQLMVAAFVLLCVQPAWLYSIGFQLSFLAVLSLILFYQPVYSWLKPKNAVVRATWSAAAASIAAELLVAPFVAYYFHIFPLTFIVANVAAFLFMGIVLVAGMLVILFSAITPVASGIAAITTGMVTMFNQFVYWLQQLNPGWMLQLNIEAAELLLIYLLIALLSIGLLKRDQHAVKASIAVACLLLIVIAYSEWQALRQLRVVVYNVNRANHVEMIEGRSYRVLNTGQLTEQQEKFSIRPAHIGWYADTRLAPGPGNFYQISSKAVLLLDSPTNNAHSQANYIILNFKPKAADFTAIQNAYSPRKIILGSHVSLRQSIKWKHLCDSLKIPLHATQTDGAFVLESL